VTKEQGTFVCPKCGREVTEVVFCATSKCLGARMCEPCYQAHLCAQQAREETER
jgi:hypothetical protein